MTIRLIEAELTSGFTGLRSAGTESINPIDEHENIIYLDKLNKLDIDVIRSLGSANDSEDISRNNAEGFGNPH